MGRRLRSPVYIEVNYFPKRNIFVASNLRIFRNKINSFLSSTFTRIDFGPFHEN